ncbi:CoA transferase [Fusobacterium sp.]|uniref:CaiB/BaiF CoA transferase family protein n=1 Tax=Fusobacterium sp. TaxID=68766 RepID=UPI0025BFEC0E|nr:CoA transferase [Fusobacterium sp.]MCI7223026.1 CoA transferase [Fusobacterium sp.]
MNQPLKGVRVIDLTYFVAGPGTGKILADWGADVIKIEPSFGDPGRKTGGTLTMPIEDNMINPFYTAYNSNKRGLSINLKTKEGLLILDKLLEKANVFLTSYRTGALIRLGLDYETLSKKYPHIIWAQVNGFGDFGPAKDKPGFDTVAFWARSGAMIDIAEKGTIVNPAIAFGDATTSCSLAGGICAALYEQQKTGKGQKVMVSLFAQAIWNLSTLICSTQFKDSYPKTRKSAVSPVINSYKCKDDKWIFLSILEHERYYKELCHVIEREDLIEDERFKTNLEAKKNAELFINILDEGFARFTQEEIIKRLSSFDIAHEKIQHVKEVLDDPQALENNYIFEFENRDMTKTKMAMTPVKFNNIEINKQVDAPKIGEHNEIILKELGYSKDDIERFYTEDILSQKQ